MAVNNNACFLNKRAALESIASKLAPTEARESPLATIENRTPESSLPPRDIPRYKLNTQFTS
jgi:hypothetical protein